MAAKSKIEWTESTWNPLTGCDKVSPGCFNCYAERLCKRLKAMGNPYYGNGFQLTLHEKQLLAPSKWKKPRVVFVNSMSDLFHKDVPDDFIKRVFNTMRFASQHKYQVLTKRSSRLGEMADKLPWPENVWMGVSVENVDYTYRIDNLRKTDAAVKFLSLEPLLGPIPEMNLTGIDWVIVGGESGPGARAMKEEWVLDIKTQCLERDIPFFFKQWGGVNKKKTGRTLQGRTWDAMPLNGKDPRTLDLFSTISTGSK